jgi:serine phosphatase RsbU (regulator of sigma subunit)
MSPAITSLAYRKARLRTERLRVAGAIIIVSIFIISGMVRILLFGSHMGHLGVAAALGLVGYEFVVLLAVERAIKSDKFIPDWFWTVNVIIEMSMPVIGTAFLASDRLAPDYRPLATVWVLLFFPFLVLSTLRLSPMISIVAGIVGALGYLLAASYLGWHIKSDLQTNPVTHTAVPFFAVMICATGFIAALVAGEIRKHLEAALKEAETERMLKQMEHDLGIARSIQQSLLPKVRPRIDGYEIAGWNRSADATGGDYFDWNQLEDGTLVVTLADVTGHGIGPALLAAVCRAYARASFNPGDSLANVMQRINKSFGGDLSPGRFATFVAAVCRGGDDNLELLSAGHAPLFIYSHGKRQLEITPAHDVPLGILPQLTSARSQVVSMQPGDLVLLITDGFLEWENSAGEQFGTDRLEEFIQSNGHLGPEEIIAELYARVLEFAGGTAQQDDLTAVVIKKTAAAKGMAGAAA